MTDLLTLPASAEALADPFHGSAPKAERTALNDHGRAAALLGLAIAYATLRYNVFKGVPWPDWPAYTLNKALGVGALLLIAASVIRLCRAGGRSATLLLWGGALALTHSLLSFALLNPVYYPRLYDGTKLTALAGLSLTLGAVLMAAMELGARRAASWSPSLRHAALAAIAFGTGLHASLPAVPTWLDPATWPGGMPPLTLISFTTGTVALLAWLRRTART